MNSQWVRDKNAFCCGGFGVEVWLVFAMRHDEANQSFVTAKVYYCVYCVVTTVTVLWIAASHPSAGATGCFLAMTNNNALL